MDVENLDTHYTPVRKLMVKQLVLLCTLAQAHPDTLRIYALLHAVIGATLLNREDELIEVLTPLVAKMKEDAELAIVEIQKRQGNAPESDDFFDTNDIIH